MGANSHGENTPHSLPAGRTGKLTFPLHRIPLVTLGNLFVMLLLGAAAAWWWRAHGVRERALLLAKQHCAKQGVELLDENVARRRLRLARDHRGQWRLSREFGFEFTVSGEERYAGRIVMYGYHLGAIELAPHRFEAAAEVDNPPVHSAEVIRLDEWRQSRQKKVGD
ncbi:hypothetical protein B8B80_10680 [Pseudomonas aeruginosa]|nr:MULTISPECIES: DUF3301 domain-containing protein [Pseudomonas]ESR72762.1 hypothetical protein T266_01995 [Pseudomonas aeruginosa VRFPA05]HBY4609231.1 DUF3301 domain-containing protein [Klebsiella pneumoniae]ALY36155.1 hypothetical protein HW10_13605 [Pseudomonas aeruginosa]ALY66811.1 hypothetical protein HW05_18225 [Pseudomonas aeruginosa]APC75959.1 hypothetical protein AQ622_05913 [Pseudomonas aeruginosa]